MKMDTSNLEVLCLQKYPELVDQTVELLNSQWPRSKTARLRSIEQGSLEGFPTSLVLIDKSDGPGKEKVLAHSKISPVPSNDRMCFVESVVVAQYIRGKGLGRLIMTKTEDYVKQKGITTVYLTTHDQQVFYEKLGYALCEPVVVFGGRSQSLTKILNRNMENLTLNDPASQISKSFNNKKQKNPSIYISVNNQHDAKETLNNANNIPSQPPPPPPPPLFNYCKHPTVSKDQIIRVDNEVKVTMKKDLLK